MKHPIRDMRESLEKVTVSIQSASDTVQITAILVGIVVTIVIMVGVGLILSGGNS